MNWFKKKIVAEDPQDCTDSAKVVEIDIASSWSVRWRHTSEASSTSLVYTSVTKRFFKDEESAKLFADDLKRAHKTLGNRANLDLYIAEEKE